VKVALGLNAYTPIEDGERFAREIETGFLEA
jgi:hypothetical protein